MEPEPRAENEREMARKPRKRYRLGRLSYRQERALDEMLSRGVASIRWIASESSVPESTLRRWLQPDHPFRVEYERRLDLRRQLCEAAVATAADPKCSPWTRLEAIRKAEQLSVPPPSPDEKRTEWMLAQIVRGFKFGDMYRGGVEKPEGS